MDPVEPVNVATSPRQWLLAIAINVAMLAELCIAMYLAAASPDSFTATFIKAFFGMLIPTLIAGHLLKRRLRTAAVQTIP